MNRLQKLLQKELNKPHSYHQLKEEPFPYLHDCNRLEIFQFIFQLEAENQELRHQVSQRYPQKNLQECMKDHAGLQAKKRLIDINKETIEKMNIEIRDKMEQVQKLKEKNNALQIESQELTKMFQKFEGELIEAERQKRFLEMKLKRQKEREAQNVDLSSILANMYKQVKQTLNQSL